MFWGDDPRLVGRTLEQLHDEGIRISLDDFGTGYASLTHLKDFPIDCLKIDQTFIAGLGARPQDMTIVNAIVDLGHNLGMDVVEITPSTDLNQITSITAGRLIVNLIGAAVRANYFKGRAKA